MLDLDRVRRPWYTMIMFVTHSDNLCVDCINIRPTSFGLMSGAMPSSLSIGDMMATEPISSVKDHSAPSRSHVETRFLRVVHVQISIFTHHRVPYQLLGYIEGIQKELPAHFVYLLIVRQRVV